MFVFESLNLLQAKSESMANYKSCKRIFWRMQLESNSNARSVEVNSTQPPPSPRPFRKKENLFFRVWCVYGVVCVRQFSSVRHLSPACVRLAIHFCFSLLVFFPFSFCMTLYSSICMYVLAFRGFIGACVFRSSSSDARDPVVIVCLCGFV